MSRSETSSPTRLVDPRIEHSRRAICRAALEELADAGYGGFRIESVASRAGVGRSTVYRHWATKAELIEDALQTLNTQPDPKPEIVGTARQRVELLLNHLAGMLTDSTFSACVPALIQAAETDPAVRRFLHEYSAQRRQRLTETVVDGIASGEFPDRIDPDAASVALSGALFYRRLMTDDPPDADLVRAVVDTVLGR
jgi:TetR/AcrR family transcriptional regulator of autoinduction and epiphytic fitness